MGTVRKYKARYKIAPMVSLPSEEPEKAPSGCVGGEPKKEKEHCSRSWTRSLHRLRITRCLSHGR